MEYLCHKLPQICSPCRKHFPVLSSFMTYHQMSNQMNTTDATGIAYSSGALPFLRGVRVARSLVLCICFVDRCLSFSPFSFNHCVVCPSLLDIVLYVLLFLTIVLSVLLLLTIVLYVLLLLTIVLYVLLLLTIVLYVLLLLTIVLSVLRRFADSLLSLVSSSSSFIQRVTKKWGKLVCILDVVPTFECICCWIYYHINVDQFNILYDLLELKPTMVNKKLSFLNMGESHSIVCGWKGFPHVVNLSIA